MGGAGAGGRAASQPVSGHLCLSAREARTWAATLTGPPAPSPRRLHTEGLQPHAGLGSRRQGPEVRPPSLPKPQTAQPRRRETGSLFRPTSNVGGRVLRGGPCASPGASQALRAGACRLGCCALSSHAPCRPKCPQRPQAPPGSQGGVCVRRVPGAGRQQGGRAGTGVRLLGTCGPEKVKRRSLPQGLFH